MRNISFHARICKFILVDVIMCTNYAPKKNTINFLKKKLYIYTITTFIYIKTKSRVPQKKKKKKVGATVVGPSLLTNYNYIMRMNPIRDTD